MSAGAMDWRDSWFVQNIAGELPVIGPCLKEKEATKAVREALKSTCMYAGGIAAMVLNPFGASSEDSANENATKMCGNMVIGATIGKIGYNLLESASVQLYRCASAWYETRQSDIYRGANREGEFNA